MKAPQSFKQVLEQQRREFIRTALTQRIHQCMKIGAGPRPCRFAMQNGICALPKCAKIA